MTYFAVDLPGLGAMVARLGRVEAELEALDGRVRNAMWMLWEACPESPVRETYRRAWLAVAHCGESLGRLRSATEVTLRLYVALERGAGALDGELAARPGTASILGGLISGGGYPRSLGVLGWLMGSSGNPAVTERQDRIVGVIPIRPGGGPSRALAPRSVADLVAGDAWLDGQRGRVRVLEVPQPDGTSAWIVQIPGTQDWSLQPGEDPFDLTTNARAMAGQVTGAATGVTLALEAAQQASGRAGRREPVLLTGHSQGGILATQLAADPAFRARHDVRAVAAAGSPVNRFVVPPSTPVLSIEHTQDPVPRLDGQDAPQVPGLVTVTLPLVGVGALASHDGARYVGTAEIADDLPGHRKPGLSRWRGAAQPFLRGGPEVVVRDYRLERGWQNPRS